MSSVGDEQARRQLLAPRAARAIQPALSYFKAFFEAQENPWTPETPDGSIAITVAENKLNLDLLQKRLRQVPLDFPDEVFCYANMRGLPHLRAALAGVLEDTFFQGLHVNPDHLTVSAGCGAIIENLFHCICSWGDGVLIPAPYYPAFDNDLQVKAGAVPIPVWLDKEADIKAQLTEAKDKADTAGHPVRVLLLTNPNNPLGTIDPVDVQLAMLDWGLENHVHVVSDEIYGNSVWGEGASFNSLAVLAARHQKHPMGPPDSTRAGAGLTESGSRHSGGSSCHPLATSIAVAVGPDTGGGEAPSLAAAGQLAGATGAPSAVGQAAAGGLEDLLHVVWGLSKDFGASGLRVGVLWSQNPMLAAAMDNLGYFAGVSGYLQWLLSDVLEDRAWVRSYIQENARRMREAYHGLSGALSAAGIPHVPANSAMFCWVDLRAGLLGEGWDAEDKLWEACVECGVVMSPGRVCHAQEPGFFRMCWSWVDPRALPVAVQRIKAVLDARKGKAT